MSSLSVYPLRGIPEVSEGQDLAELIARAAKDPGIGIKEGDVLVITHKIVSKAEGRVVDLSTVQPSEAARKFSKVLGKDARVVELILRETKRVVRMSKGIIICETRHGFVCANAGVDQSNIPLGTASLLPSDPDESARQIREAVKKKLGANVAVIISDTFGRPWREGQTDVAIGVAGMKPIIDYRGIKDKHGYKLKATMMAIADELASAAELVMKKTHEVPAAIVRGYDFPKGEGTSKEIIRKPSKDLFR